MIAYAVCTALRAPGTVYALPSFVTDPPYDEQYYYDFGEAEAYDATRAWALAEERARESVRYQIETRVEAMQLDYVAQTGKRAEGFFTEVRHLVSDVIVQAQKYKSESEGNKYYVLVRTGGIEEKVLELVKEYAQKTNDPDFEQAAKKAMKRAFDKAAAVIQRAEGKAKEAELEKTEAARRVAEEERKKAEATRRAAEAAEAARKMRERADYAKRNSVGINLAFEWSGDKFGMGLESIESHWSFLPFTSVGIGWYPYFVGGYDTWEFETSALGASLYAGLVYPLATNDDGFNVRLYTDFLFTMQGVFDKGFMTGAGFDAGIALTWDGPGLDIRYRGVVYEGHYVNSLGIGFVWMSNDR
jgi:hypothetical protein